MPDLSITTSHGSVTVSRDVVADVVADTAAHCYGVVGLLSASRVGRIFRRDGVSVGGDATGLKVELHVVVEYGLNLAEVAASVRSQVAYEVERVTGLPVALVEVVIQDVKQTA